MSQTNSRFLFVIAPCEVFGLERLLRCRLIAQSLVACGGACTAVVTAQSAQLLTSLAPFITCATTEAETLDGVFEAAGRLHYDAVVIDHPGLSRDDHVALAGDRPSVVLDDLAERQVGGVIVVNPSLVCASETYRGLSLDEAEILGAPLHALVTSDLRRTQGAPRLEQETVRKVLLAIPSEISADLAMRMVDSLRPKLGEAVLEILLPPDFANLRGLSRIAARDTRLSLHASSEASPDAASRADVAIIALGAGLWDYCARGLPIVAISAKPSDHATAAYLAEHEAAIVLDCLDRGFEAGLERALVRLMTDPTLRARLGGNSATLVDGGGPDRIAQKLIGLLPR